MTTPRAGKSMNRYALGLALVALLLPALSAPAAEMTLKKEGDKRDTSIKLRAEAPSYRAPPGSYLYGGPYPPPHSYYYPFPYPPPYPYPPAAPAPAPMEQQRYDAGHVIVLVEPISAEVYFDGLRLKQRDDLSYAVAVLEGRHVLRVAAKGYETYEKPLEVMGGRGAFVTVRLSPAGGQPEPSSKDR
jgi:hypothetical protein